MKLSRFLTATALAGVAIAIPQAAFAQDTSSEAEAPAEAASQGQEVTVVGSRIRRDAYSGADPIQVVNRTEATQAGFISTTEILQSTAITGGTSQINNAFGGFVTAGGPGANTISLRGLGATRTLTLLNGRRVAPAGSRGSVGSADLNVLPSAMLDRIEILNTGASSIYGSDAVAGVINLVTRTDLNGIELEAQHNIPELGAGGSQRYSAVFGITRDNFSVSGSLEYFKRDTLSNGDVDFTACQTNLRRANANEQPGSTSLIDPATGAPKCFGEIGVTGASGSAINSIGTPAFARGTVTLAPGAAAFTGVCDRFRPLTGAGGAVPGFECVGGGTIPTGLRDTISQSYFNNDLISPVEIYTGFLQAAYQMESLGNAEVYAELLVNRRNSSQLQNRQLVIDYRYNSPLIPTELRFATPFLGAQAGGITGTDPIGIRVFADGGNYENRQTVDFVKLVGGIRGDLFAGWRYDGYISRAWSDSEYTTDLILTDRLSQSLDVVASGSGFVCRDTSGGCVAAPALTAAVVGGQFPTAWRNYIYEPVRGTTKFRETVASVTVDGPLFRMPGGMVQVAVGAEYREASIDDTPGTDSQRGNLYSFTSSSITRGSDSVKELFGEIEVPLLADMPFIHQLTINGSARYTDYASYGSQTTYKIGGIFSPVSWLSARGSYGTSYRAPALFEQFLGATSGFQSQNNDPCNNYQTSTNENRRTNCANSGIPEGFQANTSIRVNQLGGAETGLSAETSKNYTFGGIFQPNLGSFGRFSLAVDYFNVLVENGVSQLGFATILSQCYDSSPADFQNNVNTCALIQRASTAPFGLTVTQGYVNISNAKVSGWDFNARYVVPLAGGTARLNAQLTKFDERYNQTLPTDPIRNQVGSVNNPEWTGTFDVSYSRNRWTARYGVEWLQATKTTAFQLNTTQAILDTYFFETPDYFLHSASVRWEGDRFGFTVGVRNLTNAALPEISSGSYNRVGNVPLYSGYDYLGRRFFVNVNARF